MSEESTSADIKGGTACLPKLPENVHPLPEDKFVSIGMCPSTDREITLCYNTFGNPMHEAFLLVRGLATTLLGWPDAFCRKLADAGYYVIRYDNRDVGLSTHLNGLPTTFIPRMILPTWLSLGEGAPPYSLHDMARDGMLLLTKLKINKAHLLGSSMGAMIVQIMATDFPERVHSLTIMYGHSSSSNVKPQSLKMRRAFLEKPTSSDIKDVIAFKVRQSKLSIGDYAFDEPMWTKYFTKVLNRCPDDADGVNRHIWALQRAPSRASQLRSMRSFPVLIIHGMQDNMVPYENALELAELIPHAKLILYPRMGHYHPPELDDDIVAELKLLCNKCTVS